MAHGGRRRSLAVGAVGLAAAAVWAGSAASQQPLDDKPNIVVILVDDAALMDFGVYGGEARTPHIDALAESGTLFLNHRTSPLCAPSRAMLLTGVDNHRTGVATIPEVLPPEHEGRPGYLMRLEPGVLTLADRLKPLGYRTLMTGKWHLGEGESLPDRHGFDRSFALDASGADNWEDKSYMPFYAEAPWYEDGAEADLPDKFYSSEFIVDRMIHYLEETAQDAPFLAYLAFQAVHIPVQAPAEFTANYDGVYDEGWPAMQAARWTRAKTLGLIPEAAPQPEFLPDLRDWNALSADKKALFAARMEVNAGMLEAMDHHVGRFVDHLEATGAFENTLFVVTSDNGPEPTDADDPRLGVWLSWNGYHRGLEGIGEKGSYGFIGPEFASAASSPSRLFKFVASEGGLRVPLIMSGPGVEPGARVQAMTVVTDIAPTVLEMTGAGPAPAGSVSIDGRSLTPLLSGARDAVYGPDEAIGVEVSGNAALYKDGYKIVRNLTPYGDGEWRLFDLRTDPGETLDLAAALPDVFDDLMRAYDAYAERTGVLETPPGYDSVAQVQRNMLGALFGRHWGKLLAAALVATLLVGFGARRVFTRQRV